MFFSIKLREGKTMIEISVVIPVFNEQ
jgi:polyisoprenyl-phosphate glycosyltransferase